MNSFKYSPFLIKPNIEELSGIFNTEVTKQNVNIYAEKLISLGAQNALISMGGDGAYLSCSDGKGLYMPAVSHSRQHRGRRRFNARRLSCGI